MGILNLTPDSFYDGGKYSRLDSALKRAEEMVSEGAGILDVGGESTRPGSQPVSVEEEIKRVVPVVGKLAKMFPRIPISVDTQKAEVAYRSLKEGASIINDVSALRSDANMVGVLREFKPKVILMHMRGRPKNMQNRPRYVNVVDQIKGFLYERVSFAAQNGIPLRNIWVDPGVGFGKTLKHNLLIIAHAGKFLSLRRPVVLGLSRKSFIGRLLGNRKNSLPMDDRLEGSIAAGLWAYMEGVSVLRVHDVAQTRKALVVMREILRARRLSN